MSENFAPELVQSVREYYKDQGGRNCRLIRFIKDTRNGISVLLVNYQNQDHLEMSALMLYWKQPDGHYIVSEIKATSCIYEDFMIEHYIHPDEMDLMMMIIDEAENMAEEEANAL